jgi:alpha-ketoglutarate-dependent 2,4-dichlorophenoxyacetate dioxygenase
MKRTATPLHPFFVANITDIDVGKPIDKDIKQAIERAMDEYAVCVLPEQHLEDEQQVAFSRLFGRLDLPRINIGRKPGPDGMKRRIAHKEIFDFSNLDENGGILGEKDARSSLRLGTQRWHTDGAAKEETSSWSMLHARAIPPDGGDTEFADTRAAYDALSHELIEFATQPQFVYRHKWQVGDLVIWDNRCTMHRATPFEATDHVRDMRRTTLIDTIQQVLVA